MRREMFLNDRIEVVHADCRDALARMSDASIDSVVTDPPYGLAFMGKSWDSPDGAAFAAEFWAQVLRVLKPGGWVIAASGTRTYHRLACAVEDAGFEIRDMLSWLYGSGFPKSHDVSKAIDRHNGDARPVVGRERLTNDIRGGALLDVAHGVDRPAFERDITSAASAASAAWEGWGTALKPACEPLVLARKPLVGTVASNVIEYGTGALNIRACRIGDDIVGWGGGRGGSDDLTQSQGRNYRLGSGEARPVEGRWPANVLHDGSDEVVSAFPDSDGQQGDVRGTEASQRFGGHIFGDMAGRHTALKRGDTGSAARFFYSSKADANDRFASKHPTVKPVGLMQWLVRLVTPPGGLVLDPFAGSGTTGEAAWREGMRAVLIEREVDYVDDISRRLRFAASGPAERKRERMRASGKMQTHDDLPLFGGSDAA